MKSRRVVSAVLLLILMVIGARAAEYDGPKYDPSQKEFYLSEAEMAFIQPGLNLQIQSVEVSGSTVIVTFRITDNNNQGLDRLGVETPGSVSTTWVLSRINPGETQYTSYRTNAVGQPAGENIAANYQSLGNGVYKYTFSTTLPSGYPAGATHTVGVYATRDLRALAEQLGLFQLVKTGRYIANATSNFVPSGGAVIVVRDVVRTEACNQCHDPLGLHGGARQKTELCILCHQPQNIDPDSGNTVDFKVMIHKIHRGAGLPSVQAGRPYQIIGFNNTVFDYSHIVWPQDTRNCTTCHQGGTQSDNYKTKPSRAACGSCHDDVNFATGEHHPGGVQLDDNQCSICHAPDGAEFDFSVAGIHTIPAFSKQLKGLVVEITGVTNTNPGSKPTVTFTLKDNAGNPIALSALASLTLRLAGPTTDYTWMASENALSLSTPTSTGYSFTFQTNASAIPAGSKGTFAVGAEAIRAETISASLTYQSIPPVNVPTFNPLRYFSVDGSAVVNRREVVNVNTQCNVCHKRLVLHGGNRLNTSYCIMCHNPATTDNPNGARVAGFPVPEGEVPTSINFRFMIHRIHSGEDLSRDFTVYRSRGVFNFNEILFPGDRRNCAKCHVNNSQFLPLPSGMSFTVAPRELYSPLGPAASACLGCHDSEAASAHAFLQTAVLPGGKAVESCATCHAEGADFSVSRVHAR
ncbi:MAG: OmcA/MtrC family decaheme c-type cytochrome [Acidobacteria bacterium]|nr:OmcA/MtrC family decaheme c-type cytochrome [Acidobacteriota bacterium]